MSDETLAGNHEDIADRRLRLLRAFVRCMDTATKSETTGFVSLVGRMPRTHWNEARKEVGDA